MTCYNCFSWFHSNTHSDQNNLTFLNSNETTQGGTRYPKPSYPNRAALPDSIRLGNGRRRLLPSLSKLRITLVVIAVIIATAGLIAASVAVFMKGRMPMRPFIMGVGFGGGVLSLIGGMVLVMSAPKSPHRVPSGYPPIV